MERFQTRKRLFFSISYIEIHFLRIKHQKNIHQHLTINLNEME